MATFAGNPAAATVTGAEIVPITQSAVDKRVTIQQIADANESQSADLASASTTDIGAATTPFLHVTGTTTITALGDAQAGARRCVVFDDVLILTHDGTALILPTGADVTTAAGDAALFVSEGGGNWRCVAYQRADGSPLSGGGGGGSPGGSDTQVQFNDSGSFGGDAGLVFNKTTDTLTLVNATFTGLALTAASATGGAGLRLPHGAAPTAPVDGDVWTTSAGGMYVRINGVTVGPLGAGGGGGLTGFTSALNTSSPNNTINASSLIPSGGTTNQDGVYGSKGTGALQAQVADNTSAGGNRRGANAVDWQTKRSANTAVASGTDSVAMGVNNTASGQTSVAIGSGAAATGTSTVAIGTTASSSGANGSVAIGASATASGNRSVAIGGSSTTASGDHSVVLGYFLTADGKGSIAMGGWATVRGIIGKLVRAVDRRSAAGDSQVGQLCYGLTRTANATPVVLTTDGGGAGTTNQMILAANTTASFHGTIVAHGPAGDWKTWEIKGGIHRGATAGSTAVGTTGVTITVMDATAGAAAWTVAAAANTTNGGLTITVTGAAATDIDWGGNIHTAERTA